MVLGVLYRLIKPLLHKKEHYIYTSVNEGCVLRVLIQDPISPMGSQAS